MLLFAGEFKLINKNAKWSCESVELFGNFGLINTGAHLLTRRVI